MPELAISTLYLGRSFGSVRAVDGLGLQVPRGSVYAFLGPNGAGKTTTIRMILGLVRPGHGEVRVFGQPITHSTRRDALRRIGALVEAPSLYPHLTGRENLQVTQGLIGLPKTNVERALQAVRLEREADRLVSHYSLGMGQRLGLALTLLGDPDLLILDEPTNGLDPAGIHEIRDLVRRLPTERGITVFLSSHLLGEVEQVASHVGIIGRGKLLFQGTLAELRRRQRERVFVQVDHVDLAIHTLHREGWRILRRDENSFIVELPSREEAPQIAALLVASGAGLHQFTPEQSSLEDIFLDLTQAHSLDAPSNSPQLEAAG